jgi:methyl-accepting chemotaxis protein
MKFRLTITGKLSLGFGLLTLAYLINAWFINNALQKSKEQNLEIIRVYQPSVNNLEKMYSYVSESRMLLKNWVLIEKETITPDKLKLMELMELQLPFLEDNIIKIYHQWPQSEQIIFNNAQSLLNDSLLVEHKKITGFLNKIEAYNDRVQLNQFQEMLKAEGRIPLLTDKVLTKLTILLDLHKDKVRTAQAIMDKSFENSKTLILVTSIILLVLAVFISVLTIRSQVEPINYIKKILISMGKGILPNERIKEGTDEIGEISSALNSLVKGLKDISNFSMEIGKGNFNSEFAPLSDQDILGNSLIKMREELRNAAIEDEKRKKEDDQRNWSTQGIAKFSDILRQNNNNLSELTYNIISNLVNYLNANQGGIFIVNDNDPSRSDLFLELSSCYAYNRQKFLEKSFNPGEGLIGRCYQERETIFLTDIPKDYIKITSGLGDDNPTNLLIVPLLYNDQVFGVIELASFSQIENYHIDFVEKIGTSIASTVSAVKINMQTTKLLEQSRQQAEEMASQEEEMRQNMEELRATQEETARKEATMQKELKELKKKLEKYEA